ncbi:MAG: hypothetical protein KatS3mg129_2348 [Leptospiraceae bacterium]|nr:MAG: hypothetical protein KatS3mg129_2348 [Leptospiraceae bacterium]
MKPTFYWKILILLIYIIYYSLNFNSKILILFIFIISCFILVLLFLKKYYKKIRYLIPVNQWNLLYVLLFLMILLFISQYNVLNTSKINYFSKIDYEKIKKYQYGYTFYGKGNIIKTLYPGMYLTEFQITDIKVYKKNKNPEKIDPGIYKNKVLNLAISIPVKELEQDCKIYILFYGKRFFYPLEAKNGFYEYLLKNKAEFYIKLYENNIIDTKCDTSLNYKIKNKIIQLIRTKISTKNAQNLIIGMLLGNSNWMDKDDKDKIKKLGLLHLFAASGLHLGIFFLVFYFPLSKILGKKHILSFIIPLPFLFFYLWILNFPYTLIRAYIFLVLYSILLLIRKKLNILDLLVNAILMMIIIFPLDALNLSTIMSFLAVSGIMLFLRDWSNIFIYKNLFPSYNYKENIKYYFYKFIIIQFLITFSASFFLQPLLFYVFKGYSLFSPVYNMIFVPIISLFLPLVFITILFYLLLEPLKWILIILNFIWNFIDYIINLIYKLIDFLVSYTLWIEFPDSINSGFIISILMILNMILINYLYKRNSISEVHFKKYFFIVFGIYQISLFFVYGISFFK